MRIGQRLVAAAGVKPIALIYTDFSLRILGAA